MSEEENKGPLLHVTVKDDDGKVLSDFTIPVSDFEGVDMRKRHGGADASMRARSIFDELLACARVVLKRSEKAKVRADKVEKLSNDLQTVLKFRSAP